jgi:prepilin-type N-terminal cleavage/methylation domain-containing protein
MRDTRHINHFHAGFTLVELIVTMTVLAVLSTAIFMIYIDNYRQSSRMVTQASLDAAAQLGMSVLEHDVRYSFAFSTSMPAGFSDPYGRDTSGTPVTYSGTSSTARSLLLSQYATTTNALGNTRQAIYKQGVFSCVTNLYDNPKLPYLIVYFVYNNSLFRRTITDTTTATCNPPQYQKQSCPPSVSPWNAICEAADEAIAENVSSFAIDYYSGTDTSPTDVYASSDPAVLDTMDSIGITLTLATQGSAPISSTTTMRIARVNHP